MGVMRCRRYASGFTKLIASSDTQTDTVLSFRAPVSAPVRTFKLPYLRYLHMIYLVQNKGFLQAGSQDVS